MQAKQFSGKDYDLVCIFDALHDMGDPVGAARHMLQTLKPDGKLMVVEPLAGETRLTGILKEAGFSTVRKVMDTATNMTLEATP